MIGKHLAVLNLFRERDGSVQVTCASATGATAEFERDKDKSDANPNAYVERLIVEAARAIAVRRPDLIQPPVVIVSGGLSELLFGDTGPCDDPNCPFCHGNEDERKVH